MSDPLTTSLLARFASCIIDGRMFAGDIEIHALPWYHCAPVALLLRLSAR